MQMKDGRDYYTKLWDATKKKRKQKDEILVNVHVAKDSMVLGEGLILRVQVYSQVKRGRIKQAERRMSKGDGFSGLRAMAGLMAATLAEECCKEYGDVMEPIDYEKMGRNAFDQIVNRLEKGELTVGVVRS
jgi:hypothetical protein